MRKTTTERLKDLREDHDLTQDQVGIILGMKKQNYNKYEKGHITIPVRHLITLANFYGTSADYILGLTDIMKPYPRAK